MNDKNTISVNNSALTDDELENIGAGAKTESVKIRVACTKCGRHLTINSETKKYVCRCGHILEFAG